MKNLFVVFSVVSLMSLQAMAMGPCKGDIEKFCKGVQPGEGRIVACLKQHEAELTAECKAKRDQIKEMHSQMKAPKMPAMPKP